MCIIVFMLSMWIETGLSAAVFTQIMLASRLQVQKHTGGNALGTLLFLFCFCCFFFQSSIFYFDFEKHPTLTYWIQGN